MAAVVHQAATTMTTASPMSCSAGLMRRAAQAAPIPEPTLLAMTGTSSAAHSAAKCARDGASR